MKRRNLFKGIGAVLFGGVVAKAEKESSEPTRGTRTEVYTWTSSDTTPQPKEWNLHHTTRSPDDKRKGWQLCRAIYDYDGLSYIEGCTIDNERFREAEVEGYYPIKWIIGRAVELNRKTHIFVMLEGRKDDLEYVLGLMSKTKTGVGGVK